MADHRDEVQIYSDGGVENKLLSMLDAGKSSEEIMDTLEDPAVFHTFSPSRETILNWYPFEKTDRVLEVGAGMGAVTGLLCRSCKEVVALEMSPLRAAVLKKRHASQRNLSVVSADINTYRAEALFDHIIVIGVLEYAGIVSQSENPYVEMLQALRRLLKPNGTVLLAIENRFGLKYWCGAQEDHTGVPFEGVAGYHQGAKAGAYEKQGVATFDGHTLDAYFQQAGFSARRFYYPLPDYKFPITIFSDSRLPAPEDIRRIKFGYSANATLIADERELWPDVIANQTFPFFANSYLVEAACETLPERYIAYATQKRDCLPQWNVVTKIDNQRHVRISCASDKAKPHLQRIYENYCALKRRGVPIVPQQMEQDEIAVDYIDAPLAVTVFREALRNGQREKCFALIDQLKRYILLSSDTVEDGNAIVDAMDAGALAGQMGAVLKTGYVDMTFVNCFVTEGTLLCFDQEWTTACIPASYILFRAICGAYEKNTTVTREELLQYAGISDELASVYQAYEQKWLASLMNPRNLKEFDPPMYHKEQTLAYRTEWMRNEIERVNEELRKVGTWGQSLDKALAEKDAQLTALSQAHEAQSVELNNKKGHIEQLLQSERTYQARINQLAQDYIERSNELIQKQDRIAQLLQKAVDKQAELSAKDQQLYERQLSLLNEQSRNAHLTQLMEEKQLRLNELTQSATEKQAQIEQLTQSAAEKQTQIEQLTQSAAEKQTQIDRLTQSYADQTVALNNQKGHIELLLQAERDNLAQIGQLQRDLQELRELRELPLRRHVLNALLPMGTRRRFVVKMGVKTLRHPIRMLSKLDRKRFRKLTTELRNGDISLLNDQVTACIGGTSIQSVPVQVEAVNEARPLEAYEKLTVPPCKNPQVSIIIPVYNQFHYTYECIKSILQNSGDIPYEIILADDCSTDHTMHIHQVVSGLRIVRTKKNLRFLLNCNNAAKHARGSYLLFLNNDTQVQEDWLQPLVTLIESDAAIGMVGSKLIYPDGRLQEAGGILWRDGSAWNYGNKQDASLPQFNYVKEADYISGASIMIRADLWKKLGGFDTRFAPAYCEDSDLAFMVRQAGYRVMYQPKSVVVHFEGVSNGTDTSAGLKAYQVENQKKFFQKWQQVLQGHNENAQNVFNARDRSIGKKTVLFVDHYVPMIDKDAGSRTVFAYIRMFVKQGYNVKFIGDNFYQHEPYTTMLQQMGVEVLYGSWYANHWKEWVSENRHAIGYAFLNRPHIAVNYIDYLRENTQARIVYYGHDLHFLRIRREAEVTGNAKLFEESRKWRERELALMRKADMSYYPSQVEVDAIHSIDASIHVKAIPAYLFDHIPQTEYRCAERKDLFFIGGFNHGPNVDAVKWLANEILPLVRKKRPDIQVHIAGSEMPQEVKNLEGNGIILEGRISDEQLAQFYAQSRLCIVPLRYGAGIKGKVVESMVNGLPVVTTPCGAEGIVGAENILICANTPVKLAEKLLKLYDNEQRLSALAKAGQEYVKTHFCEEAAVRVLAPEFDFDVPSMTEKGSNR